VGQYSPAKTGEYPRIFPNFQNCACCEKDLKDNKCNSLHLGQKYAHIFVLGHYLFLIAHSFPRAMLLENCSLLRTDNVHGQYLSIFLGEMEAIVYLLYVLFFIISMMPKKLELRLLNKFSILFSVVFCTQVCRLVLYDTCTCPLYVLMSSRVL